MKNTNTYFDDIGVLPRSSGIRTYIVGFTSSLLLTGLAYALAVHAALPPAPLVASLLLCACLQFALQALCFLHISGRGSRERLIALCAAAVIVLILVSGSIWIMFTLNSRMMPSEAQMDQYMNDQQGI